MASATVASHLDAYQMKPGCNYLADIVDHGFENLEALNLVFGERVFLGVASKVNGLPQGFHVFKVIQPFSVNHHQILISDKKV